MQVEVLASAAAVTTNINAPVLIRKPPVPLTALPLVSGFPPVRARENEIGTDLQKYPPAAVEVALKHFRDKREIRLVPLLKRGHTGWSKEKESQTTFR